MLGPFFPVIHVNREKDDLSKLGFVFRSYAKNLTLIQRKPIAVSTLIKLQETKPKVQETEYE